MIQTFVIGLREGVEAALIVGIIAAFLIQQERRDALRWMWVGVGLAVGICIAIGISLQLVDQQLPQKEQEGLETVIGLIAVGVVTFMIIWMRNHARTLAGEIRAHAASALAQGSVAVLVGMAFFAVIREGFETSVFLLAVFQNAKEPLQAGIGALLGVFAACAIGWAIYRGGTRINLARFFRVTGFMLVLVAAGLLANSMHTAHEAGWINFGQAQALDLSWLVTPNTWTASLLTGMFGLRASQSITEVVAYLAYLVPMGVYVAWPDRWRGMPWRRTSSAVATASALVFLGIFLSACGDDSSSTSSGKSANNVKVDLVDGGCSPKDLKLPSGLTNFEITNTGTDDITEFEVLDGETILGEKENLTNGLSGSFSVTLQPGRYTLSCSNGSTKPTGTLLVTGKKAAETKDVDLRTAVKAYQAYVEEQAAILTREVKEFAAAVKSGDVEKAKTLFASARAPYEQIEPVAESFGSLDPEIDARVNDVEKGQTWTGFHKLEQALWKSNTTAAMDKVADELVADVERLTKKIQGLEYEPAQLANGANELLGEVSKSKITGEEDRYSHTDLSDFEANVAGSRKAFELLEPALRKRNPELADEITDRFNQVDKALEPYESDNKYGNGYVLYDEVTPAQRRKLSQAIDALAEPLSQTAAEIQKKS